MTKKGKVLSGTLLYSCELVPGDDLNIDRRTLTVEFSGSIEVREEDLDADKKLIVLVIVP